jgi:hypothetical protein
MPAQAKKRPLVQGTLAHVESLPPPVGGWNARDALANMQPTDAVTLTNLFPTPSTVQLRGGSTDYATGMPGQVQSLLVYNGGEMSKMFAIDDQSKAFYDVSADGPVGAPVVPEQLSAFWECQNIATQGGNFLYAVDGVDSPLLYNGTNWTAITGTSTPAITGVDPTTFDNVILFQNRLWFIQKHTLQAWYLPTLSIGGAAQLFDLGGVARKGGYLVAMGVWSADSGDGLNDMLVFVTSQGEIVIYQGTDPASTSTFALLGVWAMGAPVTKRCMVKWAGDLLINLLDGLLPMSLALQSNRLDPRVALSNKIQNVISLAAANYGKNTGWDVITYPAGNAVILNVPVGVGQQQQYVMNTFTQSWCNFTGWAANCFALFNDQLYFGSKGVVTHAWDDSYSDNGKNINSLAVQAFNYFELRGVEKYFTRARPNIISTGQPSIQIGVSMDFNLAEVVSPLTYSPDAFGRWDVALFDQDVWGQSNVLTSNWQGVAGIGYCAAPVFQSASQGIELAWASTDIVFQTGWSGI